MRKCVLVVDDHAVVRRMVCSLFEDEGFEVCDAENGAVAVERAQRLHPDLIVLDMAMPVMNGLEAARALKLMMPLVPLIMFTNIAGMTIEKEARAAGIAVVVSKSDAPEQLLRRANALLS